MGRLALVFSIIGLFGCGVDRTGVNSLASNDNHPNNGHHNDDPCEDERQRGPDYCALGHSNNSPTHCHSDRSNRDGVCHDGRCRFLVDNSDEFLCPDVDAGMSLEVDSGVLENLDAAIEEVDSSTVGCSPGSALLCECPDNLTGYRPCLDNGEFGDCVCPVAPECDAGSVNETGGAGGSSEGGSNGSVGGSGGNSGSGGGAGDQGSGGAGGSSGSGGEGGEGGGSGTGGAGGSSGSGGVGGDSGNGGVGGSDGVGGSGPGFDPQTKGPNTLNRVGFGCNISQLSDSVGFFSLVVIVMVALFMRKEFTKYLFVGFLLVYSNTVLAESHKYRLNLDLVSQFDPVDETSTGQELARRVGVEFGLQGVLTSNVDVGASLSVGEYPGLRLLGTFHTDRSLRTLNPFVQVRGVLHPVPGSVGLGVGTWVGGTVELGKGRVEFGPAVEVYTAPSDDSFRSYSVLGLVGYQFDFGSNSKPKYSPVTPLPNPAPPSVLVVEEPESLVELTATNIELKYKIQFDFDSYRLRPESLAILDDVVSVMSKNPDVYIRVEGNTCTKGSYKYNLTLSQSRANAVADYLVSKGIAKFRLEATGLGYTNPLVPNNNEVNREKNRRVEFVVVTSDE